MLMAGKKDPLERYREKRDFTRTPEPPGKKKEKSTGPIFVVQKHAARNLHYDFRLEVDGVLKSWAVPKGPCADPKVNRLAMATEDHPVEYAGFEGVIPEGQYGGGTVMVWDTGAYRNLMEEKEGGLTMAEALERGKAEFRLDGKKLKGAWVLIRTGKGKDDRRWLLKKMKDEYAGTNDILADEPDSAISGRSLEEIAGESE